MTKIHLGLANPCAEDVLCERLASQRPSMDALNAQITPFVPCRHPVRPMTVFRGNRRVDTVVSIDGIYEGVGYGPNGKLWNDRSSQLFEGGWHHSRRGCIYAGWLQPPRKPMATGASLHRGRNLSILLPGMKSTTSLWWAQELRAARRL